MFKPVVVKHTLYRKFLERMKAWNEKNPDFPVYIPSHIKSVFEPYACAYREVNADNSPFGIKDTKKPGELQGVYVGGLNCSDDISDLCGREISWVPVYGVCDTASQAVSYVLENQAEGLDPDGHYILVLTPIFKKHEPPSDGWRWCKWGPYVGERDSVADYLHDEPYIDALFVYHVLQVGDEVQA